MGGREKKFGVPREEIWGAEGRNLRCREKKFEVPREDILGCQEKTFEVTRIKIVLLGHCRCVVCVCVSGRGGGGGRRPPFFW